MMSVVKHQTILIVDDEPNDLAMMNRSITKQGKPQSVLAFNSGFELMNFFNTRKPLEEYNIKVICLDLRMQKMNGFQVLEYLKTHDQLKKIPVMICTSSEDPLDVDRSYELGANAYFVKPIDYKQFIENFSRAYDFWEVVNRTI